MNPAIEKYLVTQGLTFNIFENTRASFIDEEDPHLTSNNSAILVRTVLFRDTLGLLMAILPANHMLNYDALCHALGRELTPLTESELMDLYGDYKPNYIPPLPEILGLSAVVATGLDSKKDIYFLPGNADKIMQINFQGENSLWTNATYIHFSEPISALEIENKNSIKVEEGETFSDFIGARMKKRVQETYELPSMPHIAKDLLALRVNPRATAIDLAAAVEKDPSLVAQIISWARSPYYGYTGKIESVEDAIIRVLGYDLVMNLALGLSIGHSLRVPLEGPLGLRSFWLESMYTAVTVDSLAHRMKWSEKPLFGLAYLGGMLHNFGRLVLAHLFVPQFRKLELYVMSNPHVPISLVERRVVGIGHETLAAWALTNWRMPEEVVASATSHHELIYRGEYDAYVNLVGLASRMMKQYGIGDAESVLIPEELVNYLGLTFEDIAEVEKQIFSHKDEMIELSRQMLG